MNEPINVWPAAEKSPQRIYLLGIGGTGVGALAGLLKRMGHTVRGVDLEIYPPMSDKLAQWNIAADQGYHAEHLEHFSPDLVVVGNVIRRDNPMAQALLQGSTPYMSMAQALGALGIADRHSMTVAGTHGKTTTTALISHALMRLKRDPSFLVGGALLGFDDAFRSGAPGPEHVFVVEGDEYDTAFFDKGPKFLHYRATTAIITSLEFDHADIFANIEAIEAVFAQLISSIPDHGHVVVWEGAERALRILAESPFKGKITRYGKGGPLSASSISANAQGTHFMVEGQAFNVRLWGSFGVDNSLAAIGALRGLGLSLEDIAYGLDEFAGIKRRLHLRFTWRGMRIVDDFGHHPTAVRETLGAVRARFEGARLWALFEPRSATNRRNIHQEAFAEAFSYADAVIIGTHSRLLEVSEEERFDAEALVLRICTLSEERGSPTLAFSELGFLQSPAQGVDGVVATLKEHGRPGDVVLVLSNGDFGGLFERLSTPE